MTSKLSNQAFERNSTTFSASFAESSVEIMVMTDQEPNENLMPPSVFSATKNVDTSTRVINLRPPRFYAPVDMKSQI